MSTDTFQTLTALLTIATAVVAVALLVLAVARERSPSIRERTSALADRRSLMCAVVAGGAMLGSLYFSEVANYVPCTLCWYQRIAMYSIAIVAVVAVVRRETPVAYFMVLAAIGAPIAGYHWLLERLPSLDTGACSVTVPCNLVWFEEFGFITLPLMAFVAFVAILAVCIAFREDRTVVS